MKRFEPLIAVAARTVRIFCLAALVMTLPTSVLYAAGAITRIQVQENTRIEEDQILLGRIAKIQGDDPVMVQRLQDVVVGRAPLPGSSRRLEDRVLNLRLKQNGFDLARLNLEVPDKVVVTRSFMEIDQEKIKALVNAYLVKNIRSDAGQVRIKQIRVGENVRLPAGRISYKVVAPRASRLLGKVPLAVNFDVNGKFYRRIWVSATIEILTDVVVTRKPLGRYKPITEDDISVQKMDLSRLPADIIRDPEMVLGKRTRRALGVQTVLRPNLVEFPPLVKRGDMVMIIAETQGLKITTFGQVKKKGRRGERIPVINLDSKKTIYARVVDSKTVKIEF